MYDDQIMSTGIKPHLNDQRRVFFLFNCTDRASREAHLENIKGLLGLNNVLKKKKKKKGIFSCLIVSYKDFLKSRECD